MILESAGVRVHGALCGDDALAHLAAGVRPDVVISDFRLPGYDGIELVRRVRQAMVEDLPAILITGDTSGEQIRAANLCDYAVLHKPADTEKLIAMIECARA
ncbi:response regulator [Seongchinamella sediminis]|uniref:Response regulator n=2 Tax=Seongchinamella sediminis TaxID=2283635 RepID=A0A3L7DWC1_9GAMM|nr:response regulator [Seongchinamella sediminis]